ncbi:MAG: hypothetical protein OXD44_07665 [Gammaproteobacteria bacterium]|nr:hypothetical protein [Gammaproteobacteria bacterium]
MILVDSSLWVVFQRHIEYSSNQAITLHQIPEVYAAADGDLILVEGL